MNEDLLVCEEAAVERWIMCVCFRAFFWLLSLLLSSLVWFIAVKASNGAQDPTLHRALLIFGVFFSVLIQEVFRFAYYRLLR